MIWSKLYTKRANPCIKIDSATTSELFASSVFLSPAHLNIQIITLVSASTRLTTSDCRYEAGRVKASVAFHVPRPQPSFCPTQVSRCGASVLKFAYAPIDVETSFESHLEVRNSTCVLRIPSVV